MKPISLSDLNAHAVTSVTFIHDYIQLVFDDYCVLSIYNPIKLRTQAGEVDNRVFGFKDSLCELIGHSVSRIEYEKAKRLALFFDDNSMMSVGLEDEDYSGPEAVELRCPNRDSMMVIRVGE